MLFFSCSSSAVYTGKHGGPYFYGSLVGYTMPRRLHHEILEDEATEHGTYYIGYFDDNGVVISIEHVVKSKSRYIQKYYYKDNSDKLYRIDDTSNGATEIYFINNKGEVKKGGENE